MKNSHVFTIFFIAFFTIFYELLLTRLFSFLFFYENTFLIITTALFFFSLGHLLTYYVTGLGIDKERYVHVLAALLFVSLMALGITFTHHTTMPVIIAGLLPFSLLGTLSSMQYVIYKEKINHLYLLDLLGTIAASLIFLFLYQKLGELNLFMVLGLLSVSLFLVRRHFATALISFLIMLPLLSMAGHGFFTLDLGQRFTHENQMVKRVNYEGARHVKTLYDYFTRLDIVKSAPGKEKGPTDFVYFDGMYSARIMKYSPDNKGFFSFLALLEPAFYRPYDSALVLGAGGGMETYFLLSREVKKIESIEISRPAIEYVKQLPECSLFFTTPSVTYINDDGRGYLRRSPKHYDLITLSLLETAPASFRGGAHTQNYLFTTDAFKDYISHLNERGNLLIIQNQESLRDRSLSLLLSAEKKNSPGDKIIIARNRVEGFNPYRYMILYSKSGFTPGEREKLQALAGRSGIELLYTPADGKETSYGAFITSQDWKSLSRKAGYDLKPVSDDRPFFYNLYHHYDMGMLIVTLALVVLSALVAWLFGSRKPGLLKGMLLFLAFTSGFAFMSLEQALIYRLSFSLTWYHKSLIASLLYLVGMLSAGSLLFMHDHPVTRQQGRNRMASIIYGVLLSLFLYLAGTASPPLLLLILLAPVPLLMGVNYLSILNCGKDRNYSLPVIIYFNGLGIFASGFFTIILLNSAGISLVLALAALLAVMIFTLMGSRYMKE
jgi:hypothetical protein